MRKSMPCMRATERTAKVRRTMSAITEMPPRGKEPTLRVVPMGVFPDPGKLEHYRALGVGECVLRLPSAPRDAVLPVLDDYTRYL